MVVLTRVNFQFAEHNDPAGLWQHAFNRDFNHTLRTANVISSKDNLFDTTDVAGVVIVHFVSTLVAGYSNFVEKVPER